MGVITAFLSKAQEGLWKLSIFSGSIGFYKTYFSGYFNFLSDAVCD
jgi:hypothetical protein